jgi:hypothetical protein
VKSSALAALLAVVPIATSADTDPVLYVPRSERFIQRVYVHTGTTIDIALPEHESLTSNPIIGDPRWTIATFLSGRTVHVSLKPRAEKGMDPQLLTIPGSSHALHLVVSSGPAETTAFTVDFFEPTPRATSRPVLAYNPAPMVTPAALRPRPAPTPRVLAVRSCDGLDSNYSWHGDSRIDLIKACEDQTHSHTFFLMREGRNPPGVVPFKVDAGGRQDQIRNATFVTAVGSFPSQWVVDGVGDKWALVADSSTGQIRTTIEHGR